MSLEAKEKQFENTSQGNVYKGIDPFADNSISQVKVFTQDGGLESEKEAIQEEEKKSEILDDNLQQEKKENDDENKETQEVDATKFWDAICGKYSIVLGAIVILALPVWSFIKYSQLVPQSLLVAVIELGILIIGWNYSNEKVEEGTTYDLKKHWLPMLLFVPALVLQIYNLWALIFIPIGVAFSFLMNKKSIKSLENMGKEICMEFAAASSISFFVDVIIAVIALFFTLIYVLLLVVVGGLFFMVASIFGGSGDDEYYRY